MSSVATEVAYLTVGSVGKMTTYELRQQAEKRGLLKDISNVNHAALLRRLVQASTLIDPPRPQLTNKVTLDMFFGGSLTQIMPVEDLGPSERLD